MYSHFIKMFFFILLLSIVFIPDSLTTTNSNKHILVMAPPILSHIIPSLELAKQLSIHCHVTYLISEYKVKELEDKGLITKFNNNDRLRIIGLNDGNNQTDGFQLQDSQINLNNISQPVFDDSQLSILDSTINRMSSALDQLFLSGCCSLNLSSNQSLTTQPISRPIDMIIARSVTPLPLLNLSIPFYLFLPSNLRGVVSYLRDAHRNESRINDFFRYLQNNINQANGFICNSLKEFDQQYLEEFYQLSGKQVPMHFIGPLIFDSQTSIETKTKEIIHWLDKQPVGSVIYIAFGSIVRIPLSAIDMIGKALSTYSFIWSLKTTQPLPSSLMNLNSDHQLILEWTPQRDILGHPSVSFFFSHGGWNSLMEGMLHGQSMLVWPFFADQFDNAQQLVDLGIARQVSNNLQMDIEYMLMNNSYIIKAKQIQQMVIRARESTSKQEIADIIKHISNKTKQHNEL